MSRVLVRVSQRYECVGQGYESVSRVLVRISQGYESVSVRGMRLCHMYLSVLVRGNSPCQFVLEVVLVRVTALLVCVRGSISTCQ